MTRGGSMDRRGFLSTGMAAGMAAGLAGGFGALGRTRGGAGSALDRILRAVPGKTLADGTLRLSSNENPLGLAPAAREAVLEALVNAGRYPGEFTAPLYPELARHLGVEEENILFGAGSTEILQIIVQAYQGPGVPLIQAEPTFEDVGRYQRPLSYDLRSVPLTAELAHDIPRMREMAEEARTPVVVYLCNPNNPTGTVTPAREIDAWIAEAPESVLFLVDEAYHEYAEDPAYGSALHWIGEKRNVIVVRTFSKIYGMAGLRLGYGLAHPDTLARLRPFTISNNPNILAAAAAQASLRDEAIMARSLQVNREARDVTQAALDDLGLEYLPSHANFLMHRVHGDLQDYIQRMRDQGIRVGRPFPPMTGWNRISFGLPEEMERWAGALRGMRARGEV
jgi:histidinol-phosphate aminotransferase